MSTRLYKNFLAFIVLLLGSCVEEFVPETVTFDSILVIEASISNELKQHEVKLSRTFRFEEEQELENEAIVKVIDNLENVIDFYQSEPGVYKSINQFSAEPGRSYRLEVVTKDNEAYTSQTEVLPSSTSQLGDISFSIGTNSLDDEGVNVVISSFDPTGNSKFYRYEFEETYQIVAPLWRPDKAIVISDVPPFQVDTAPRTQEERVCYNTITSNTVLQIETNSFMEDRVTEFPLKFISKKSPTLRDRYSILVKQYVQSIEAFNFYKTLNEFSSSESLFTENQPGFLDGNIASNNPDVKVIGYFEVSSFSSKRVFTRFEEIYPGEGRAPYFSDCVLVAPELINPTSPFSSPLINNIKLNLVTFIERNSAPSRERPGPFLMTNRECGDCTVYGSNVRPDFWID